MRSKWGIWYNIKFENELIGLVHEEWFLPLAMGIILGLVIVMIA